MSSFALSTAPLSEDERVGVYDWLLEFEDLEPILRLLVGFDEQNTSSPVCVVGCGTSTLSERLIECTWWGRPQGEENGNNDVLRNVVREVWSADYDPAVITHMEARTRGTPGLKWFTADLSEVPRLSHEVESEGETSAVLPAAFFGAVLDKGTFDAMVCEGLGGTKEAGSSATASAALMSNAARMLAPGSGLYIVVSLHPPRLIAQLLCCQGERSNSGGSEETNLLGFELMAAVVVKQGAGQAAADMLTAATQRVHRMMGGQEEDAEDSGCGLFEDLEDTLPPKHFSVVVARRLETPWRDIVWYSSASKSSASETKRATSRTVGKALCAEAEVVCCVSNHLSAVAAAHTLVMDEWFVEQHPLLTPEREERLIHDWRNRVAIEAAAGTPEVRAAAERDGATASHERTHERNSKLSLQAAYEVMFSEMERSEFTFDYFLEDAAGEGVAAVEGAVMTLAEATEFLRANQ